MSDDRFDADGLRRDPVEAAVRSVASSLARWGSTIGDLLPASMFWVQARSSDAGVVLSLTEPAGFDADVLSGLRGLVAPPEMLGVALSVPAPLELSPGSGPPYGSGVLPARMAVVLLRDATAAATVTAPGVPCRFTRLPPDPVGGFLRRTVGLPSQLASSVSLPDVAARHLVSARVVGLAGLEAVCDPAVTPAGVAARVAGAGGTWSDVLGALADPEVVAPDAPSADLVLCVGAMGGGWADEGVVAHDLDRVVPAWPALAQRWAALPRPPCDFADAQRDAFSVVYA